MSFHGVSRAACPVGGLDFRGPLPAVVFNVDPNYSCDPCLVGLVDAMDCEKADRGITEYISTPRTLFRRNPTTRPP